MRYSDFLLISKLWYCHDTMYMSKWRRELYMRLYQRAKSLPVTQREERQGERRVKGIMGIGITPPQKKKKYVC
jgi:hypothetical protein